MFEVRTTRDNVTKSQFVRATAEKAADVLARYREVVSLVCGVVVTDILDDDGAVVGFSSTTSGGSETRFEVREVAEVEA